MHQGVRNVCFSENLACFVFLKHLFSISPFSLITEEISEFLFINKRNVSKEEQSSGKSRLHKRLLYDKQPCWNGCFVIFSVFIILISRWFLPKIHWIKRIFKSLPNFYYPKIQKPESANLAVWQSYRWNKKTKIRKVFLVPDIWGKASYNSTYLKLKSFFKVLLSELPQR